jgi:hypothetical protein
LNSKGKKIPLGSNNLRCLGFVYPSLRGEKGEERSISKLSGKAEERFQLQINHHIFKIWLCGQVAQLLIRLSSRNGDIHLFSSRMT